MAFSELRVDLGGFALNLRPDEIRPVSAGLPTSPSGPQLAAALSGLPVNERAPAWEVVVRHLAHGRTVAQAATSVGLGSAQGERLWQAFNQQLGAAK